MQLRKWNTASVALLFSAIAGAAATAQSIDDRTDAPRSVKTGDIVREWDYTAEEFSPLADAGLSPLAAGSCQLIGGADQNLPLLQLQYRGNVFRIERTSELQEIRFQLAFCGLADLSFSVHRSDLGANQYVHVYTGPLTTVAAPNCGSCPCTGTFTSGLLTPPVILQEGFDYAIGVTWSTTPIRVFRDVETYPMDFPDGSVRGSIGFGFNPGPPLGEDITIRVAPFTGGAWQMQVCIKPKPGACCLPGGACQDDMTESACLQAGGKFTEETLTCADLANPPDGGLPLGCPLALGACCLDTNCANNVDKFSCEDQGGLWKRGLTCTIDTCLPTGACCLPDGTCAERSRIDCETPPSGVLAGIFQGDDTNCAEVDPACGLGACCTDSICLDVSRAACASVPGVWGGNGSNCDAGVCDPVGACCLGTTCQDDLSLADCVDLGGIYQGDWSLCNALPSPCGKGACCRASGCTETTQSACEGLLNGEFQGENTSCATLDPPCEGICCFEGECIDFAVPDACGEVGGTFVNYGQSCRTNPSPCAPAGGFASEGACCLNDETCVHVAGTAAGSVAGSAEYLCLTKLSGKAFTPDAMDCDGVTCPAPPLEGACCLPNGECYEVTESACTGAGGTFQVGMTCSLQLCARGACCNPDGTCDDDVSISACSTNDTSFFDGAACSEVSCTTGACCLPTGACGLFTERGCAAQGGQYAGNNTTCDVGICDTGACCIEDGSCLNGSIAAACNNVGGTFNLGATCQAAMCPQGGACCVQGKCRQLTEEACANRGGFLFGIGQACTTGLCPFGACCEPNGDCVDTPAFACNDTDQTYRAGFSCNSPGVCPGTGACCVPGDGCQVRTQLGCQQLGGVFNGLGSTCSPIDPCESGACCFDNGQCVTNRRYQCDQAGGDLQPGETCATSPCPPARACCGANESCTLLTRAACEATLGNVFLPVQLTCNSTVCDVGACCLSDGCCVPSVIQYECLVGLDGASYAPGTACMAADCQPVPPTGACCDGGSCTLQTEADCNTAGGVYQGDDSACNMAICRTGGCCAYDGTCSNGLVRSECDEIAGIFSPGLTCGPGGGFQCPVLGACCENDVCTDGITLGQCNGAYGGAGSRCSADSCDVGACCLPVGTLGLASCQSYARLVCDEQSGYFRGAGITCESDTDPVCATGSCCASDGTCTEGVVEEQCDPFEDAFMLGVPCDTRDCVKRGACCYEDMGEICEVLEQADCTAAPRNGLYTGDATSCDPADLCLTGACCLPDDTCDDQNYTRYKCEQAGGLYEGAGVACGPGVCTLGACCLADGSCEPATLQVECESDLSGVWHTGVGCSAGVCPPVGPCFILGEDCRLTTAAACTSAGGVYAGDGQTCPVLSCQPGACHEGGTCLLVNESDCIALGGVFDGPGVLCPRGGCCNAGFCSDRSQQECDTLGGSYLGNGVDCFDGPCDEGGCCLTDGTCADTYRADCADRGGQFNDGMACGSLACPQIGACCAPGGCQEITEFGCTAIGGTYEGDGTTCLPNPCVTGACCLNDGSCADTLEADCQAQGGLFNAGEACGAFTCPATGACCKDDGSCAVLFEATCIGTLGNVYLGDDVACDVDACTAGACCKNDGSCTELLPSECTAQGGDFMSGTDCASNPCPPGGACCGAGGCEILTEDTCTQIGGSYQGDGVSCTSPDPCATGACCVPGAGCLEDLTVAECQAMPGGNYIGDNTTCSPDPCTVGACCDAGSCSVMSEADCLGISGAMYEGDATTCTPNPCNLGACCVGSNCVELSEAACIASPGVFQGEGVACTVDTCAGILNIVSSDPASGTLDAREPHPAGDAATEQGYSSVTISFDGDATGLGMGDFAVTESPDGTPPVLGAVQGVLGDPNAVTLTLVDPIDPGNWTVIEYLGSAQKICIGFLPGDVDGNRTSESGDIDALIAHLNGSTPLGVPSTDINRSGTTNVLDLMALIDVLNGAEMYDPWLGATLPPSPCGP
ncbi:MAG: hypothetical protein J5J06_19260 [Phycisphaerae bacterium]|nr:hypothetical protein [Phycisphaerae bacterium]